MNDARESSMEQETATGREGNSRRLLGVTIAFLILLAGWALVTSKLTSASTAQLGPIENRLRGNRVAQKILPSSMTQSAKPEHLDLLEHFAFYFPFGLLAGIAGEIAGQWRGRKARKPVMAILVLMGIGWALLDEFRQIKLPDRSADWDDLIASWLGIVLAALIFLLGRWLLSLRRERMT